MNNENKIRTIAFYLPQYHPIPENDEWWGKGFTEWRNVVQGRPLFPRHYQPRLPADLGFYDLRVPETREAQADLAREHGIFGFCYYHYWFNGRRVLGRPFDEVVASGRPDFPFCLCWANENWTRRWDGQDQHILLKQSYSHVDDQNHIEDLISAFSDSRYIRINGKPIFLVYRAEALPDARRTTDIWREHAVKAGVGDLYLVRVLSYEGLMETQSPEEIGFDAESMFSPFSWRIGSAKFRAATHRMLQYLGLLSTAFTDHTIIAYDDLVRGMDSVPEPAWKRFSCVTPSWDNSARKSKNGYIFLESTPARYGEWLRREAARTAYRFNGEEQLVFINAWNEWAEGNYLEPDQKWGRAYLSATRDALKAEGKRADDAVLRSSPPVMPERFSGVRRLYWKVRAYLRRGLEAAHYLSLSYGRWFAD